MRITLDRKALFALIEADPEFRTALQASVLAEVARRMFERDSTKIIAAIHPALFHAAVTALREDRIIAKAVQTAIETALVSRTAYGKGPVLSAQLQSLVHDEVVHQRSQLKAEVAQALGGVVEDRLAEMAGDIDATVNRIVGEEIEKVVRTKVAARLALVQATLAAEKED